MHTETPPLWAVEVIARLDRIERALTLNPLPLKDTISALDVRAELNLKTRHGLMKWAKRYNLAPISKGVYRMDDFRAAKARAALRNGFNTVRRQVRVVTSGPTR